MPAAGARSTAAGKWLGAATSCKLQAASCKLDPTPCRMCLEQPPDAGPAAAVPAHAAVGSRLCETVLPRCLPLCSMFGISCKACTATTCTALDVTFKVRTVSLRCCPQPPRCCSRCSAASWLPGCVQAASAAVHGINPCGRWLGLAWLCSFAAASRAARTASGGCPCFLDMLLLLA